MTVKKVCTLCMGRAQERSVGAQERLAPTLRRQALLRASSPRSGAWALHFAHRL